MKNKGKLVIIVIILIIVALVLIFTLAPKHYTYQNDITPPTTYKITINRYTKTLQGEFTSSCSYVGCNNKTVKRKIKLTSSEYKKIMILWHDKDVLSPILEALCSGDEILYNSFSDSMEENIKDYNSMDLNNDGKITNREFANKWLNDAIKENHK